MWKRLAFMAIFCFFIGFAEEDGFPQGLIVDLRQPMFCDGVLSTEQGGVIQAPDLRIQAQKLRYTRKTENEILICSLYAEGEIIIEFGDNYFVGDALEYDFITKEGVLWNARTSLEPWYFGGEVVILHADGSFTLINGFITTSENIDRDWEVSAEEAHLIDNNFLTASNVKFKVFNIPLLWLPWFKTNLDSIFDAPVRYYFKWGGRSGARAIMIYEIFDWNNFKTFARLDYRVKRGFGGGIETYYRSDDRKAEFNTINYVAHDNSLSNPHEKIRYRFQGLYHNLVWDDRVTIDLSWDKLSDRDMATDYNDRGLELDYAGRTQLIVRKQEINRIEQFITYVKVNPFQTENQELPTVEVTWRPQSLGETGIISTTLAKASFLDFSYSNDVLHGRNFTSTRVEFNQNFYRPFLMRYCTFTPEAGFIGIHYGNSPQSKQRWLALGVFGCELKTGLTKVYYPFKHVIEPYIRFDYFTGPTVVPRKHYIFDINDGWFHSNSTRIGFLNELYIKHGSGCLTRPIYVDLFTYAFFDEKTIGDTFPKAYLTISTLSSPTLRHTLETAWDLQHGELDHFNVRAAWTVADNLAIRAEYRHRSAFSWRKADPYNFILDAYRSEKRLLHSPLSDRRDTLLTNLYYQFDPNWALLFEMRHGWNRKHERSYTEFETDLIGKLPSAWNVKLSYQHKEDDDRVAVYFSIGINRPNPYKCAAQLPCLEL